jgi:hypothetical protein
MGRLLSVTIVAAFVAVVPAAGAAAQVDCGLSSFWYSTATVTEVGVTPIACWGAFSGNDQPAAVEAFLALHGVTASFAAKADDNAITPPFQNLPGSSIGTLHLSPSINGVFVLSLKAGPRYSLFHFDTMGEAWTALRFTTDGVSQNPQGKPQDLSHASLFTQESHVAPEPATVVLLMSGLAGVGLIARRRRQLEG